MKDTPIYDKTVSYAVEHGELDAYRASYKANMACKTAVTEAINDSYMNNHFDSKLALNRLTDSFPIERIAVVVAISVREYDWDGRLSDDNKAWAKSVPFPTDLDDWNRDRNAAFSVSSVHPGLLNLFANALRKELEVTKTEVLKKPSLMEKLNKPLPVSDTAKKIEKGQEL